MDGGWKRTNLRQPRRVQTSLIRDFLRRRQSVISSVNDVMKVTHDLITTEEGKQYIEKTIKDTQTQIQKSFDEIISQLKDKLDKR